MLAYTTFLLTVDAFDWQRILFGDASPLYLLEIAFRTVVIYGWTVLMVRFISGRAVSQLSLIDFILVIALGSSVGDPMFFPDVPILHCMLVISLVVGLNRGLIWLINRNEEVESSIEGIPVQLVKDGLMSPEGLEEARLSKEKLFEELRINSIRSLGELEYVFKEQGGQLSIYRVDSGEKKAGLAIVPPWDIVSPKCFNKGEKVPENKKIGCANCGKVETFEVGQAFGACSNCSGEVWTDCVLCPED